MFNDVLLTTLTFEIRGFPVKSPVLTKHKSRQDEQDNDSRLIHRSLLELTSSSA